MNNKLLDVFSGASWVLVLMIILAFGCGYGGSPGGVGAKLKNLTIPKIDPNAPFPALSTNVFDALSAEVPELAKHREAVLAAERDAIKGALDDMRAKSKGAKKQLGAAMPEPARYRMLTLAPWPRTDVEDAPVMGAGNDDRPAALIGGLFNLIPVAMAAEPDYSDLGLVQQFLIGHQVGSMIGAGISDMGTSDSGGSKTVIVPGEKEGTVVASLTVSATPGGPTSAELATTISIPFFGLEANSKVGITGDFCPNPDGKVEFTIKLSSNGRAGSAGSVIYDRNIEAKVMATVGDDANVVNADFDLKQATRSAAAGRQVYVETSQSAQVPGGEYSKAKYGEPKTIRASSQATAADGQLSDDGLTRAYYLAIGALESAKGHWQGGKCIKIEATSPGTVQPSSTTAIPVTVRHKFDGSEIPSKLEAVLSGEKLVDPTSLAKTPGTLTYTAPDKRNKTPTITLTATSRRGRATLKLTASTGGQGWVATGTRDGGTITAMRCGPSPWGAWKLTITGGQQTGPGHGTITVSENGGTWSAAGPAARGAWSQTGQAQYIEGPPPLLRIATTMVTYMGRTAAGPGKWFDLAVTSTDQACSEEGQEPK